MSKTPAQRLAKIEADLTAMILDMSEIISEATSTRPGLRAGLALLTAQRTLAEATTAVSLAREAII